MMQFSWAAQVSNCFSDLGEPLPLVADAPITIDINLLQELLLRDRNAGFDSLPQDPRWPHGQTITAGLGAPRTRLAHFIGNRQWEVPNCTRFSDFVWGPITF